MSPTHKRWKIRIDTGGTFTDALAIDPEGNRLRAKVLSNSALRGRIVGTAAPNALRIEENWQAPDDFVKGFRFHLLNVKHNRAEVTGYNAREKLLYVEPLPDLNDLTGRSFEVRSPEEAPLLAARLITGTSPGGALPPTELRLATTRGTNALLEKKGARTALFITEGFGDLLHIGTQQRPELFSLDIHKADPLFEEVVEVPERLDAEGHIFKPLQVASLKNRVDELLQKGIHTAAIALMHSFRNGKHEQELARWLKEQGFDYVSVSSELIPFIKILPRAETTLVNAYLSPVIHHYIRNVSGSMGAGELFVMSSAGGLSRANRYEPKDSLLSGPAGGVVGASAAGRQSGTDRVISFDMGGTSTDVARYHGDFEYVFEHHVGHAHLAAPALNIETVAAGGGSICSFDGHTLSVGPESAGAFPGPACYGAGGPLTLTDINLLQGRLDPRNFNIPVHRQDAQELLDKMTADVGQAEKRTVDSGELLDGFLEIANERMADAIRKISLRKGYDPADYALVAFGGAGAMHACAIAKKLGMNRIIIPDDAGLLSATGLHHAVVESFAEQQVLQPLDELESKLSRKMSHLEQEASEKLQAQGLNAGDIEIRRRLVFMRLEGQESTLEIAWNEETDLAQAFEQAYRQRYGHWIGEAAIEVESIRVVASSTSQSSNSSGSTCEQHSPDPIDTKSVRFGGSCRETPVYKRSQLKPGARLIGPALVLDPYSTIVVEPAWRADVQGNNSLELRQTNGQQENESQSKPEAVRLELFTNRFTSIAEEMGEMLQRTALSVNVKERLDFSCALLNPKGELVVNAPHIPVHLGALGLCVRRLAENIDMAPGDVVVTNHPHYGGSHLPDVTVVTPVYSSDDHLLGYAASRAHHAEIGGIRPGSMPPDGTRLAQEGVVIPPTHLIRDGKARWDNLRRLLLESPWPTRSIDENIADLRAAVAANQRGADALRALNRAYGPVTVQHYMDALKNHAATQIGERLHRIPDGQYSSTEYLDDNTPLCVRLNIEAGHINLDFTGTGAVHPGNLNATPAIVNSVVMYVLRLLLDEPLPLNEGLLEPVGIQLPRCLLNPDFGDDPTQCPAVVGGNVEVSQRLVDTLLKPFGVAACSQGTMNNVLFGNEGFGYYETVGGGTGAGPDFDGADAVHQHMTNTRGTDPEILEHRYPVRLDRYAIRPDSGGHGRHRGGNGIIREMTFLEPVSLSVLTQHRQYRPYCLQGGGEGQTGEQWVIHPDGHEEQLKSSDGRELAKGDRFILKTPGGGGYGVGD